jgi:acetolactate synthase regulatory subunit
MSPATQPSRSPTVHEPADAAVHQLTLHCDHDPLLLQRILQKCAVPEIHVRSVRYTVESPEAETHIDLHLRCTPARAALTAEKLRKLTRVRGVAVRMEL